MEKKKLIFICLAFAVFFMIVLLPTPDRLPVAGQRTLTILALAVILWVTEAVTVVVEGAF